jgi:hypothetical protein
MSPEVTCSCGHRWETRKPLNEIEQLRCSKCNTASEEDLSIEGEDEDEVEEEPKILTSVETRATLEELTKRTGDLLTRRGCHRTVGTPKLRIGRDRGLTYRSVGRFTQKLTRLPRKIECISVSMF